MDAMLKVEDLEKRYADFPALSGVSFEVATGEVVGFLGPGSADESGKGKRQDEGKLHDRTG